MKDILNERIKYREPFRPFCPSILAERTGEYFENRLSFAVHGGGVQDSGGETGRHSRRNPSATELAGSRRWNGM
jgi:hypothetical protein